MSGKIQVELFAAVLDMIQDTVPPQGDLVNEVIEVDLAEEGGEFEIVRYPLPIDELEQLDQAEARPGTRGLFEEH